MKHITFCFVVLMLFLCVLSGCMAENTIHDGPDMTLETLLPEDSVILSSTQCGSKGAAIVRTGNQCVLYVLDCVDNEWQISCENDRAVCEESTIYLDTDEMLILTNPFKWYDGYHEQFYFSFNGNWLLSSVIRYEGTEEDGYLTEYNAYVSDGMLRTSTVFTDLEGNLLTSRTGMMLPMVLTQDELQLSCFNGTEPPFNGCGYFTDDGGDISNDTAQRLFAAIVPPEYTWVDGIKTDDCLQFIADKEDGSRVLLCCWYGGSDAGWEITESTPLPAGTTIGIENFTHTINIGGQLFGVSIGRYPNGYWGVTGIFDRRGNWASVGPGWISENTWYGPFVFGDHLWNDITQLDWAAIPDDITNYSAYMNTSRCATPNNPNANDRLHLREFAGKASKSLGKFYNGTPLQVLGREGEWTQVRVGGQVGYMMTKYLLFGDDVNRKTSAMLKKTNVSPLTEVLWDDGSLLMLLTGSEVQSLFVIGVIEDQWYLVWDPYTGKTGRIKQADLWDGNG